jgi:hypothetical protein
MYGVLKKLKSILNGLDDEELEEFDLWIDNTEVISIITVDKDGISLITDSSKLKIDGKEW